MRNQEATEWTNGIGILFLSLCPVNQLVEGPVKIKIIIVATKKREANITLQIL